MRNRASALVCRKPTFPVWMFNVGSAFETNGSALSTAGKKPYVYPKLSTNLC